MQLSVVIPVYNEQDNIKPLVMSVREALTGKIDYELILVDDGSEDETVRCCHDELNDTDVCLEFNRNYGQSAAMAAGIECARGELVVTMDGDLQNSPDDIMDMIETMQLQNCDVVAGWRKGRKDGLILRKIPSVCANFLIRYLTGVTLKDYGCTLKVFKRDVAKNLALYGELHRFIPVLACMYGAKIYEVPVSHYPRIHGVSKYGIGRTMRVFSDLLLMVFFQKYATRPMHLFGSIGVFLFFLGCFLELYLFGVKLFGFSISGRPLLVLGALSIISGIQLITTGFIAEIMMRTYYESQGKKPYRFRKSMNYEKYTKNELVK